MSDGVPDSMSGNSPSMVVQKTSYISARFPSALVTIALASSFLAITPEWESPEQGGSGFAVGVEMHLPDEQDTRSRFSLVLVASLLALLLLF
jgi:hypothetical protein